MRKYLVIGLGMVLGLTVAAAWADGGGAAVAPTVSTGPGPATQPAKELSALDAKALERLWEALADTNADAARVAIWALAADPNTAAEFLAGKLLPAVPADAQSLSRLIADLGAQTSAKRQAAHQALASLDCLAEPALAEAAKGKPSAEAGTRIGQLLEVCRKPLLATEQTRQMVRAVWALETMAGPQGRAALERIAKLDERHRASALARAALARLDGKTAPAGPYAPHLRYEVGSLAGQVMAGGKIPLVARLTNYGSIPVVVFWGHWAYEDMYVFVVRRDGQLVPAPRGHLIPTASLGRTNSEAFREIAPGEALTYDILLGGCIAPMNKQFYFPVREAAQQAVKALQEQARP